MKKEKAGLDNSTECIKERPSSKNKKVVLIDDEEVLESIVEKLIRAFKYL